VKKIRALAGVLLFVLALSAFPLVMRFLRRTGAFPKMKTGI